LFLFYFFKKYSVSIWRSKQVSTKRSWL